ncbi:heparan-alpha-glucosaminide N-acetyltransferase domain-containing protein [Microbacterium sp. MAHUQ-60]|uniref:heparan-alpha-glucosaminide N-acetyltransferase domain-containing protein n=1 Tax=unclassified Microbacterium TaxID=2609290 RepID=UPI0036228DE0
MTVARQPPAPVAMGRRIIGIDLARFLAIVGMMAAHLVVPLGANPQASTIDQLLGKVIGATISSTSATTFAALGGISMVLLTRTMRGVAPGRMLLSLVLRGLLITLVGAMLALLDGPISIVLTFYGVAMIISAPAVLLPTWLNATAAGVLWVLGGALNARVRSGITTAPRPPDSDGTARAWEALRDLLLTGHYPAITWVAYMLIGMVVARALLTAREAGGGALRRLCTRLTIAGLTVYAAVTIAGRVVRMKPEWFGLPDLGERMLSSGYGAPMGIELWMLLIPTPHSGDPADMLRTVAGACFIIGLLVGVVDARSRRTGWALESIRAAGAAPLTIYTAHVVVTAVLFSVGVDSAADSGATMLPWYAQGTAIFLLQLVVVGLIGVTLALVHRRGPLETILGWASGSSRTRRQASGIRP